MIKVIKLNDGIEVEVDVQENQAREISDENVVDSSIDRIQSLLKKVLQPISETFNELDKDVCVDTVKVNIGVKIGVEGNFILAKSTAGANIQVEMTLRPTNA